MSRLRYLEPRPTADAPAPELDFSIALGYRDVLARYARRLMGAGPGRVGRRWNLGTDTAGDAEDLLQDTYTRALLRWQRPNARPRSAGDVQAWLHRMMLRLWLSGERQTHGRVGKLIRHRSEVIEATCARATRTGAVVDERGSYDPGSTPGSDDNRRRTLLRGDATLWCCDPREAIAIRLDVERALTALSGDQRELLERVAGGEDRHAIAARQGVKRVTVDARVVRARGDMARAMAEAQVVP